MSYEDDEENERFLEALDYAVAREQEELIAEAETMLDFVPTASECPMPNTAHPALAHYASFILTADPRMGHLQVPVVRRMMAFEKSEPLEIAPVGCDRMILTAKKVAGPAPFVNIKPCLGQEAIYVWWAWVDDLGRHIATDSELVWRY